MGDPTPKPPDPTLDEAVTSTALFILISLLFATLLLGYFFTTRRLRILHETIVSIFLGLFVGALIRGVGGELSGIVAFNHRMFFNLLLPPIILNSGYELNMRNFFRNLGAILTFAFIGTFISTLIIGLLVFLFALTGIHHLDMTFLDSMIFGAILSSTDPVTVLAIFKQLKVEPKLYAIIFGESILNDSVAIVLFTTLVSFRGSDLSFMTILSFISTFVLGFFGSLFLGCFLAILCALLLKHTNLASYPSTESSLIALIAYASYLLSNSLKLSGIVSLLFCGITLKHYAWENMSRTSRRTTKNMFRVMAKLSEGFVFIYLGVTVCTRVEDSFYIGLILWTLPVVMVSRYFSVIPLSRLINALNARFYPHESKEPIPESHQYMLLWAGLRGAVAFALSFELAEAGRVANAAIRSTTLVVCVVSVILLGGTTTIAVQRLKIPSILDEVSPLPGEINVGQGEEGDSDDEMNHSGFSPGVQSPRYSEDESRAFSLDHPQRSDHFTSSDDWNHWWLGIDNRFLRPLFVKTKWKWGDRIGSEATGLNEPDGGSSRVGEGPNTVFFTNEEFRDGDGRLWRSVNRSNEDE